MVVTKRLRGILFCGGDFFKQIGIYTYKCLSKTLKKMRNKVHELVFATSVWYKQDLNFHKFKLLKGCQSSCKRIQNYHMPNKRPLENSNYYKHNEKLLTGY